MRKITRITTQKKHKNRYNIFLNEGQDEKYGFSVDETILIEYKLRKGLELDDSMITTLVQKDNVHKSYTQAINFLSYRMRTKKEIYDYLVKKEVEPEHITQIMEKLESQNLLDDKLFAEMFVRTRMNTSSKGPLLIKKELLEKGVSASIAASAVENYPYEIQYEKILKWVDKKLNRGKKESFRKQKQKLQGTLMQKGFTQDVIKDALANINEEKDEDAEWDALIYQGEKLLRKHQVKLDGYELRNKLKEGLFRKGFSIELINRFLDESLDKTHDHYE
ncbi:recombination regulator RecX [Virgibacillus profundi]|uniref:Regulatory protein RecX n=1 Tax=Virgibacillus profundi TaxID=2024555 RepID=A0A2A2I983_9BACI|nr:recombination regulator RecX [Virgibacillus profundi]PAV28132.1 recombination regulator RecX [Virgibacillus profundi]PXY52437.1 recombination regulator RecX [Virgibacillus profundi]